MDRTDVAQGSNQSFENVRAKFFVQRLFKSAHSTTYWRVNRNKQLHIRSAVLKAARDRFCNMLFF